MTNEKIERINALARKAKIESLTLEESIEQKQLREEYIAGFRNSLVGQLESTYVVDEQGNKQKLEKKSDA